MGYTHYWENKPIEPTKWAKVLDTAQYIIDNCGVKLVYEFDQHKPPQIGPDVIRFNGVDEDGHETFLYDRDGTRFSFCKTARKPYDVAVVAILEAVQLITGNTWSSDGEGDELQDGKNLAIEAIRKVEYVSNHH